MEASNSDKFLGVIICLIGLVFIFDKRIEKIGFLYVFDGSWKESPRWLKWKRILIGIAIVLSGLVAFFHGSKPGKLIH